MADSPFEASINQCDNRSEQGPQNSGKKSQTCSISDRQVIAVAYRSRRAKRGRKPSNVGGSSRNAEDLGGLVDGQARRRSAA